MQKIVKNYSDLRIAVLGSHSALEIMDGAKDEGLETTVFCQKGREKPYQRFGRIADEIKIVKKFTFSKNIFGAIIQYPTKNGSIEDYENLIVFRTFSKAYGLAGLRIGFMVSQSQNINKISKTRSLVESNTFSMQIAEYFLEHTELLDQHVQEVKEGSAYLQEELNQLGLRWHGGNYTNGILIFLNSKKESEDIVAYLKKKKIYIRGSFEPPFDSTIRISIGPKSQMEVFIEGMKEWLS